MLFIATSVVLAVGLAVWMFRSYGASREASDLVMGIGSVLLAVALVIYGIQFRKKIKREE